MTSWQNIISGILGLWIILVVILGFSSSLSGFFLIVSGLAIATLGFWTASLTKQFLKKSGQPNQSEIMPSRDASYGDAGEPAKEEGGGENNAQ